MATAFVYPRIDIALAPLLAADVTVLAPAAGQQPATPSLTPRGMVDFEAPLLLNDRLIGEIDVRADAQGVGDIDAVRLLRLLSGVLDPALVADLRARIGVRVRIPFAELNGPTFAIRYDPATLNVAVRVPVERMLTQPISFRGSEPPDPGGFAKPATIAGGVALGVDQRWIENGADRGRAPMRITADGFITIGGFPGLTLRSGTLLTERPEGGFTSQRLPTRLTYDSFGDAIHYVAGEFTPTVSGFQGAGPVLGIGLARDYAGIRPFENIRPSGRGSILLDRPSTVIVEVNGLETRRLQLEPGRYQLTDLSGTSGANDVRLFVQDELGRREVASASFFTATAMLAGGLTDGSFAIGKRQSTEGVYAGPVVASGYLRHGFGGRLTLGGGIQMADGDWQATFETVVGTPVGLFRIQGAWSDVMGRSGQAASLDWLETLDIAGGTLNLTLLSSWYGRSFGSPFDRIVQDNDTRWRIDARADWRRDEIGFALTTGFADTRSNSDRDNIDGSIYVGSGRWQFTGSFGIERTGDAAWRPRALIGVSLRWGNRSTVSLRGDTDRKAVVAEYARFPVDQVGDLSGRVQLSSNDDRYGLAGEARYFGNRFIANVEQNLLYQNRAGASAVRETDVRFGTFLGFADGTIAIGRPPQAGFAIYPRHASLDGSTVTVRDESSYLVGKQDWLGPALVPFNRAFSPVTHLFDVDPLPPGYDLGEGQLRALPGFYSGYRVPVGSDASRIALGYLDGRDGPVAEVAGTVERIGDRDFVPRPFFTNATGRFAVDGLRPGDYRLLVGGREMARFTVPAAMKGVVDVGHLRIAP